jgi:hypothetical protein
VFRGRVGVFVYVLRDDSCGGRGVLRAGGVLAAAPGGVRLALDDAWAGCGVLLLAAPTWSLGVGS